MAKVAIPEMQLLKSGIPRRFFDKNLQHLKDTAPKAYKLVLEFSRNALSAKEKSVGLTVFGENGETRGVLVYSLAKALLAQGMTVQCVDVDTLVQECTTKGALWNNCMSCDWLVIDELNLPAASLTRMHKMLLPRALRTRVSDNRTFIVATDIELNHEAYCLEEAYPGITGALYEHTLLLPLDGAPDSRWVRDGHAFDFAQIAVPKKKRASKKRPVVKQKNKDE